MVFVRHFWHGVMALIINNVVPLHADYIQDNFSSVPESDIWPCHCALC